MNNPTAAVTPPPMSRTRGTPITLPSAPSSIVPRGMMPIIVRLCRPITRPRILGLLFAWSIVLALIELNVAQNPRIAVATNETARVADIRNALQRQNMQEGDIREGDAIFFNTGWGSLWMKDNDRFNSGKPGIGLEVARWVVEKQAALVGADTWATEVVPNPDPNVAFVVHQELITKHGIFNHENLDFTELLAAGVYEFVYSFAPLRIKGATGSAGRPIALA